MRDAVIRRLGLRIQREAGGEGYAARVEGAVVNFVVFFSGDRRLRAELDIRSALAMSRRDLDTEATRIGLALRAAAATLPIAEKGKTG